MSIRWKVILPYLLLTLVVAVTGVYVVTRLVASSLTERLTNQLLQAGRVVSDGMARQELNHVETARLVAFTRGLAEGLRDSDRAAVAALAKPAAAGLGTDRLTLVNAGGQEVLNLSKGTGGQLAESTAPSGLAELPFVRQQLEAGDPSGLPTRALLQDPRDGRYFYYTALPVGLEDRMEGVVVVGTPLDDILPFLKSTALADLVVYADSGDAVATTLAGQTGSAGAMAVLSVPAEQIRAVIDSGQIVHSANFTLDGRWYSLARGPLPVADDRLGTFAVVLPLNFVLQSGSVSRNTYVLLFAAAMMAVVLVGYGISRLIINPLYALMRTSKAIAGGDLAQRGGIQSGDEVGVLANSFDEMTSRLQDHSAELERTNRILEQMDRTKVSFIDVSAHELHTPLTLVKGYAQMLQLKANGDPELGMLSQGILDGSERITEIVSNMLDVSRIDSKALKIVQAPVQLGLLLLRVRKTFQPALAERHITLQTEGLDSLPLIDADPDLLYKVFYHLVMNAIKYTPDGGSITVRGRVVGEAGECPRIEVSVTDTGIGIDPQHHELVFEKFYQTGEVLLHSSGKTKFKGGGPGLGLAIARGIIEAHRGSIRVESAGHDEGACPGSAFHVRLPLDGTTA